MVERIKVTNRDVTGILLINAMCQVTKRDDILAMYDPQEGEVSVELKINGHVVPLVPALENAWKRLVASNKETVEQQVKQLMHETRLDALQQAIDDIVDDAIARVFNQAGKR